MKIKMKLSKQEKIMALLNQWDPTGEFASSQDYRIYSFEADNIAQNIRSNSKVETIERVIKEVFSDIEINDELIKQIASLIKSIK